MLDFIYDSLDTVKKLKMPTRKQIWTLSLAIFALVTVAALFFMLTDATFTQLYTSFSTMMTS